MSKIPEREGSEGHDDEDQQQLDQKIGKLVQEVVEVSYFHYNDTGVGSRLTTVFSALENLQNTTTRIQTVYVS